MAVNFPLPDYQDVETLTEMVSRVLIPYSSTLGLDAPGNFVRQSTKPASLESVNGSPGENASENSQSH